jgi:hypothetical protein
MALDACGDEVAKAIGRPLSKDEETAVARQAAKIKARIDAAGGTQGAARAALAAHMEDRVRIKSAKQQLAAHSALTEQKWNSAIDASGDFATKAPGQVLQSMFISSLKRFPGAADSVGKDLTYSGAMRTQAFMSDLYKDGMTKWAFDPANQKALFHAFQALSKGEDASPFGKNAAAVAATMKKHTDALWQAKRDAGIPVGKLEDWGGPQIHDQYAVSRAGGNTYGSNEASAEWSADQMKWVDFGRSFGGEFAASEPSLQLRRMKELWSQFSSGNHLKYSGFDPSKNREIIYKDADAAYQNNLKYGNGRSLAENISSHLGYGGRDIALFNRMGNNPEGLVGRMTDRWEKKINENMDLDAATRANALKQLAATKKKVLNEWLPSFTGALASPEHAGAVQWLGMARNATNTLAILGSLVVLPGDLPLSMRMMAQYGGPSMKSYMGRMIKSGSLGDLPASKQMRLAASGEILLSDALRPMTHAYLDMPGSGIVTRAETELTRAAGHTAWIDRFRTNLLVKWGHDHYLQKDLTFDKLDPNTQALFTRYGISPQEWDVVRAQEPLDKDGRTPIFTAGNVRNMDLDKFKSLAPNEASDGTVRRVRAGVADKYRNMIGDLADRGTTSPSAEMRAITQQGRQAGSAAALFLDQFNSLKGWVYNVMRNHLGDIIAGDSNPENVGWPKMFVNFMKGQGGQGRMAMTKFMSNATMFGVLINALADVRDGKTPELPDTPEKAGDILFRGFLRQGAGVYGDFIAGQLDKPDQSIFDTIGNSMSPLVGDANDMTVATSKMMSHLGRYATDPKYGGDKFWKAFNHDEGNYAKMGYNLTPNRMVWTKWATDYYLRDNMMEHFNPGYKDRLQKRLDPRGQTMMLGPQK